MTFVINGVARECLPSLVQALGTPAAFGSPVNLRQLGPLGWAALYADRRVNGCGPEGWGSLVPDLGPDEMAAGIIHDMDFLVGGDESDLATANERFAARANALYAAAVRRWGHRHFAFRHREMSHGEISLIVWASYRVRGHEAVMAAWAEITEPVMARIDAQLAERHPFP